MSYEPAPFLKAQYIMCLDNSCTQICTHYEIIAWKNCEINVNTV